MSPFAPRKSVFSNNYRRSTAYSEFGIPVYGRLSLRERASFQAAMSDLDDSESPMKYPESEIPWYFRLSLFEKRSFAERKATNP